MQSCSSWPLEHLLRLPPCLAGAGSPLPPVVRSLGLQLPGWGFHSFFFWQGPATVEESVQGVLRLLAQLSATNNGTFWDWRGQSLPW